MKIAGIFLIIAIGLILPIPISMAQSIDKPTPKGDVLKSKIADIKEKIAANDSVNVSAAIEKNRLLTSEKKEKVAIQKKYVRLKNQPPRVDTIFIYKDTCLNINEIDSSFRVGYDTAHKKVKWFQKIFKKHKNN